MFILENVRGLSSVIEIVRQQLAEVGDYAIAELLLNPNTYGAPTDRCRYYIVGLHRCIRRGVGKIDTANEVKRIARGMEIGCSIDFVDLMLPAGHAVVKNHRAKATQATSCNSKCGCKGKCSAPLEVMPSSTVKCKWRHENWIYMKVNDLDPKHIAHIASTIVSPGITCLRQKHVLAIKQVEFGRDAKVMDVSQSITFAPVSNGRLPCITPGAKQYVFGRKRTLTGAEMMIMQGSTDRSDPV
jgi:hypothetical protein